MGATQPLGLGVSTAAHAVPSDQTPCQVLLNAIAFRRKSVENRAIGPPVGLPLSFAALAQTVVLLPPRRPVALVNRALLPPQRGVSEWRPQLQRVGVPAGRVEPLFEWIG